MELVRRWWNGRFGRLAGRDIWLEREVIWHVRPATATATAQSRPGPTPKEDGAVTLVERLLGTGGDGWKNLTNAPEPQSSAHE
jgi:hypothetical protein